MTRKDYELIAGVLAAVMGEHVPVTRTVAVALGVAS